MSWFHPSTAVCIFFAFFFFHFGMKSKPQPPQKNAKILTYTSLHPLQNYTLVCREATYIGVIKLCTTVIELASYRLCFQLLTDSKDNGLDIGTWEVVHQNTY